MATGYLRQKTSSPTLKGYFRVYTIDPYTGERKFYKAYSQRGTLPALKQHVECSYSLGDYIELTIHPTPPNPPEVWVLNLGYATYGRGVTWGRIPHGGGVTGAGK